MIAEKLLKNLFKREEPEPVLRDENGRFVSRQRMAVFEKCRDMALAKQRYDLAAKFTGFLERSR